MVAGCSQWDKFAEENNCQPISYTQASNNVGAVIGTGGVLTPTITHVHAQTCYRCNDGMVYCRNE